MRFLIALASLVAYANAGLLAAPAPLVYAAAPNHGDLQAAAINANVAASDHARAVADNHREAAEAAVRYNDETIRNAVDQGRELQSEAFWRSQDAGWQALSAAQSHQSAVDGVISGAAPLTYAAAPLHYAAAPLHYGAAPLHYGAAPLGYAAGYHPW